MALLEINNLSLSFSGLRALADVSFDVAAGQIVGLIGPNGAGKSTLLNCICRLYRPDAGHIRFDGNDLAGRRIHEVASMGVRRTFQNLELFRDGERAGKRDARLGVSLQIQPAGRISWTCRRAGRDAGRRGRGADDP